ncbi:cupin domain-containing protein [Cryptococcus neoformans]|nr:cupin domain-containing protein [Cryptococcus neoformans var. grubii]
MSPLTPNPLSTLRVTKKQIPSYQNFPNTTLHRYPLIIYHSAYPSSLTAEQVETHLSSVGVVKPAWRFPMYRQHHYHSNTHELLVVVAGAGTLCFGGPRDEGNKGRAEIDVEKGDAMLVPSGVAHSMIEDKGGFNMVGSYPVGAMNWDMCTGQDGEKKDAWKTVKGVKWFEKDPIYGDEGPAINTKEGGA